MATVRGGKVRPHVQAFADAVSEATGADSFGTYPGHSPSIDLALDIFVPVNSSTLGNAISSFAIANQKRYGVRYVIYRQRIWHRLDPYWRAMEDRGDLTQNHYDHAHISFEPTAAAEPEPAPKPEPQPEEDMRIYVPFQVEPGDSAIYLLPDPAGDYPFKRVSIVIGSGPGPATCRAVVTNGVEGAGGRGEPLVTGADPENTVVKDRTQVNLPKWATVLEITNKSDTQPVGGAVLAE